MTPVDKLIYEQASRIKDPDVAVRRAAVEALCEICVQAKEEAVTAVPPLLACLEDSDDIVREKAKFGLPYCGKSASRELAKRLSAANHADVRRSAAWVLGQIHSKDRRAIKSLLELAESPIASDRAAALHALGNIGRSIKKKEALQEWLRQVAPALQDDDRHVRWSAYYALGAIELPPENSLPLWVHGLDDTDPRVAGKAVCGLGDLAKKADVSSAVPALASVVGRGDDCSRDACRLLGKMRITAKGAIPALIEALKSDNAYLVCHAAEAIWEIDHRVDESLPALANLIREHKPGVGEAVCDALHKIGPAAAPLTDSVLRLLAIDDYDLQWAAADALGSIASGDDAVVNSLVGALCHKSGIVRHAAMNALVSIGDKSIPGLVRALEDGDDDRREMAADTLGKFGATALPATDALRKLLHSETPNLRAWSAIALGKIAASEEALPLLIEILEYFEGPNIRRQAAEAVGKIGPAAARAVPALRKALRDADDDVRAAADNSLAAIEG